MNIDSFLITPTDSIEVSDIISSLDVHKAVGQNGIVPTKDLKLLNKHLSIQLPSHFNLSVSFGIFQNILKISKITPVHKNDSK